MPAHRLDRVGSDEDRRAVRIGRRNADVGVVKAVVLALEGARAAFPEEAHRRDGLGEPLLAARVGDARGLGLGAPVAGSDAEHEAPRGERIEGGDDLGHLDRVVVREQEDGGRDRERRMARQDRCGKRDRLEELRQRAGEVMVAHADVVEPRFRRASGKLQLQRNGILRRHLLSRREKRAENQSELHASLSSSPTVETTPYQLLLGEGHPPRIVVPNLYATYLKQARRSETT